MSRILPAASLAACLAASAQGADLQGRIPEGLYDVSFEVEATGIEGMPGGMKMPAMNTQKCISKADLDSAASAILVQQGAMGQLPKDCSLLDFRLSGDTATYRLACAGANRMSMDGTMTFGGDGYRGVNNMSFSQGKGRMNMKMSFDGRYLGPCKAQ